MAELQTLSLVNMLNSFRRFTQAFFTLSLSLPVLLTGCSHTESVSMKLGEAQPVLKQAAKSIPINGQGRYLIGANYPWLRYGNDLGGSPESTDKNWATIASDFSTMHKQGVEVVRFYLFADGRSEPKFDAHGYVTGIGSMFLPDLDRLLKIASDSKISLLLTLSDSSMFLAYPNPENHGGGHASIILENSVQQSFMTKALKPILVHIEQSPYRSNIVGIDLENEPEGVTAGFYGSGGIGTAIMKAFLVEGAEYVHTYAKGVYVTVGSASPAWVSTWKGVGVDYYSAHYYPSMDGKDALAGSLPPGNGLPDYSTLGLDRPCVLGEFPTNDTGYSAADKKHFSTLWYLDQIKKRGYAGALGWSYAVPDTASNWKKFAPTYHLWYKAHQANL